MSFWAHTASDFLGAHVRGDEKGRVGFERLFFASSIRPVWAATGSRYPSFEHSGLVAAVLPGICLVASAGVWAAYSLAAFLVHRAAYRRWKMWAGKRQHLSESTCTIGGCSAQQAYISFSMAVSAYSTFSLVPTRLRWHGCPDPALLDCSVVRNGAGDWG